MQFLLKMFILILGDISLSWTLFDNCLGLKQKTMYVFNVFL